MTGIINLSPSWFSQGHEGSGESLHASSDIQHRDNANFLHNIIFPNTLLAAIYSIIQPDMFESGFEGFEKLAEQGQLNESIIKALDSWATPFTGLSVIMNRETITHRDVKAYRESFDLLLTIGRYTGGRLHLPGLGFSLIYDPGTVVALAGNVLQHGVCPVTGDRACLAHFWHHKVGERLGVMQPGWVTLDYLTEKIIEHGQSQLNDEVYNNMLDMYITKEPLL